MDGETASLKRGMCKEKRNDDRPEEGGTLNSGRLRAPVVEEIYLQRPNDFRPIEGVAKSSQESDLPIIVRDGNTDHTAKDQAGMQSGQRLAQEIAKFTASRNRCHPQEQATRSLELRWCHRQFRATLGLRVARQTVGSQMAQPPQPAAKLYLGHV